jgi:hypothetical protein
MNKFLVTLLLFSGFLAMATASAEAGPHFGRIAFAKHQSPSQLHYGR